MAQDDQLICHCLECQGELQFTVNGLGQKIQCPYCNQETILYDSKDEGGPDSNLEEQTQSPTNSPSLKTCKTCKGAVAESSQVCIHCGQLWPTKNIECGKCGVSDFDIEIYEDNSSVWVTPSFIGVLSAAIWGAMKSKPKRVVRCLNCGALWECPPDL
jgi:hypothetical protein